MDRKKKCICIIVFIFQRKSSVWLLYWTGAEPPHWKLRPEILLWAQARFDWLGELSSRNGPANPSLLGISLVDLGRVKSMVSLLLTSHRCTEAAQIMTLPPPFSTVTTLIFLCWFQNWLDTKCWSNYLNTVIVKTFEWLSRYFCQKVFLLFLERKIFLFEFYYVYGFICLSFFIDLQYITKTEVLSLS